MSVLNIALIGSSGGGVATVGHTEASALLSTVNHHLSLVGARLTRSIFITLQDGKSMDAADQNADRADLTIIKSPETTQDDAGTSGNFCCEVILTDTLRRVNERASELQKELAVEMKNTNTIDALICISMDVDLFQDLLQIASQKKMVITGSGGTSLAQATARFDGLTLVGNAGGSVATTTQTRAVSYTYSLAKHFQRTREYQPWKLNAQQRPSWTSVLNSALPAFWAVTLARFLLGQSTYWIPLIETVSQELEMVDFVLDHYVLPAVCCLLMATCGSSSGKLSFSVASSKTSLSMAAIIASFGCRDSVFAGLFAGYLVQEGMERFAIYPCICLNIPATMTTLLSSGGFGIAVGTASAAFVSPLARYSTDAIRSFIQASVSVEVLPSYFALAAAFAWGCVSCFSSKVGYYHALHLPLILIELERGGEGSFLGAVDELSLVLVCAGICAAKVILSSTSTSDRALCQRGLLINLLAGDFVEVCYPYMTQSDIINMAGYLASGLSCSLLVCFSKAGETPCSLAYLPWPCSVLLAGQNWLAMILASFVAFGIPFFATLLVGSSTNHAKKS